MLKKNNYCDIHENIGELKISVFYVEFHKQLKLMLHLRSRLAFPLTQVHDHTVSSYCHKQVWPWGGLDQFWVKVKLGGWWKVYFWLGTAFGCFAGWALCSEQEGGSDCRTRFPLCNCKASQSTVATKSCLTSQAAGSKPPPMTVGMALLTLAQGRSSSARLIFSPVSLEVNKTTKYQGTCQKNSRTAAQGTWLTYPGAQKMWPAPLVCCTMEHSWNVLWSSEKKGDKG